MTRKFIAQKDYEKIKHCLEVTQGPHGATNPDTMSRGRLFGPVFVARVTRKKGEREGMPIMGVA